MKELAKKISWPGKDKETEQKASTFMTCFKSAKDLKPMFPNSKLNRLEGEYKKPPQLLQLDFVGLFSLHNGRNKFVLLAVDC